MQYRTLGKTNLQVAEVGIGTWQLANDPDFWVGSTRPESEAALLTAIDQGINFIDTARVYGRGLSEKWIGEIIKKRPAASLVIASKIMPKNRTWPARKDSLIDEVFPVEHIRSQVEASLKTLSIETLDLMQFHVWQDDWASRDEWKEEIQKLTREGKVKFWGVSINDYQPTNVLKTLDTGLIASVQGIFNIFHQEPIDRLFPYLKNHRIGFISRVPLDEGGLTGKINRQTKFAAGDFRAGYFSPDRLIELENRVAKLQTLVNQSDDVDSLVELALRFILSFDEVSTAIPGMRKKKHVLENVKVSGKGKFDAGLLEELKLPDWERNFYV